MGLRGAAGPNSEGQAALRALAGTRVVRGRITAVRLEAKAVETEPAVESGAGLIVAKPGSVASRAKRRSHYRKSI